MDFGRERSSPGGSKSAAEVKNDCIGRTIDIGRQLYKMPTMFFLHMLLNSVLVFLFFGGFLVIILFSFLRDYKHLLEFTATLRFIRYLKSSIIV